MICKFTIKLPPITKKNHQQIRRKGGKDGRPFIAQSDVYKQYESDAGYFLRPLNINKPVNVKAIYYMPTMRKVDITNLHNALCDVLVHSGVLYDDSSLNPCIVCGMDGSRVKYDKLNPRTEIEITGVYDEV
jgi:Holliday junction resolvase RusA-like endonuclease